MPITSVLQSVEGSLGGLHDIKEHLFICLDMSYDVSTLIYDSNFADSWSSGPRKMKQDWEGECNIGGAAAIYPFSSLSSTYYTSPTVLHSSQPSPVAPIPAMTHLSLDFLRECME